ncbi:MAG: TM0106 family RecB-like putative nuclease [Candidatus Woesearchaeota archaeon]|jgi:predicted RecB family nuclease|nr:TM0106 family RecB-like putative nuclease [Candidatus Woesearchaeota archaeon]
MTKITAHDIDDYNTCSRKIWLKRFEKDAKPDEASGFMLYLADKGNKFETDCLKTIEEYHEPRSYEETIALMKQGVEWIYQGVLENSNNIGKPDLMRRNDNIPSKFGKYSYDVIDIKSAKLYLEDEDKNPAKFEKKKKELQKNYGLQLWHYREMMKEVLGVAPLLYLWVRDKEGYSEVEFEYAVQQKFNRTTPITTIYENIIDDINSMTDNYEIKAFKCGSCGSCAWSSFCISKLEEIQHCSLIYGMDKRGSIDLEELSIKTIKDFYKKVDFTTKIKYVLTGNDPIKTDRMKKQAQAIVENKEFYLGDPLKPFNVDYLLFYDIEGEMGHEFEYLHGVWEVNRKTGEKKYISFITPDINKESEVWNEFINYIKEISKKGTFKLIYFFRYEIDAWKNLTKAYGTSKEDFDLLMENSFDILAEWINNKLILPVYNYSIKTVAPYYGFSWECKNNIYKDENGNDFKLDEANGGESIAWLDYWLTGKEHFKQIILDYNKDDVIGTEYLYEEMLKRYG